MSDIPNLLQQAQQLHRSGQFALADQAYRKILNINPNQVDALHGLGYLAMQAKQLGPAIDILSHVVKLQPNRHEAIYQLAEAQMATGNAPAAAELFARIIAVFPDHPDSHLSRGICLMSMDRIEEAATEIEEAVRLAPDARNARANLSIARVLRGMWRLQHSDFAQGWADFEARLELNNLGTVQPPPNSVLWTDQVLHGKTLLVYNDERGLGDAVQFVRFIPDLKKLGAKIVLQCKPVLYELFQSVGYVDSLITTETPAPPTDFHVPLMSLPHRLGVTLENLPADIPYLCVELDLLEKWQAQVGPREPEVFRVGLVWAGSPHTGHDLQRSIHPDLFSILCDIPNIKLFSLQIESRGAPTEPLAGRLIDHTSQVKHMADTAALIEMMDLVITVDTATAHLAGALGREAWVLLHKSSDWRWMLETDRSPWYPTLRLFRQPQAGDWESVLKDVKSALVEKLAQR